MMVSSCLIDNRVKLTPSMISHRLKVPKKAEFFKFETESGPRAAVPPPLEPQIGNKGNMSVRQESSKLCPIFTNNVEDQPTEGGSKAFSVSKTNVLTLDTASCRKGLL